MNALGQIKRFLPLKLVAHFNLSLEFKAVLLLLPILIKLRVGLACFPHTEELVVVFRERHWRVIAWWHLLRLVEVQLLWLEGFLLTVAWSSDNVLLFHLTWGLERHLLGHLSELLRRLLRHLTWNM
jgi:hypothetical protein